MKRGDILYYARIMPNIPLFEVIELKIRTVNDNDKWFCGIENLTKHAFLFDFKDIDNVIFEDRMECLMKVKEAENNCNKKSGEKLYEEY
jgi:hypothetical protein